MKNIEAENTKSPEQERHWTKLQIHANSKKKQKFIHDKLTAIYKVQKESIDSLTTKPG